ncbi:MAG: transposase [candidate division Zixibacteria bacterium]|nr:transposase [candidate division Zixibacteria bacterium]
MSKLLRFNQENYCYFVSLKTYKSRKLFCNGEAVDLLLEVIREVKAKLNFILPAFVIMPEHLHLLIVPNKRNTISDVVRHIKGRFSKRFRQGMNSPDYGVSNNDLVEFKKVFVKGSSFSFRRDGNLSRPVNSSQPKEKVWQNSFYDHVIRDEKDFLSRPKYIHINPVKAGLSDRAEDYKFLFIEKDLEGYL